MNKLQMAHEYAVAWIRSGNAEPNSAEELAGFFFSLADSMQAEANKRTPTTKSLFDIAKDIQGLDFGEDHECNYVYGRVCLCGKVKDEWQPDWSQAPDGFDWFCVGCESGSGYFCNIEPKIVKDKYWFVGEDSIIIKSHDYTAHWRDSLRKRPKWEKNTEIMVSNGEFTAGFIFDN